jgi:sec-independent protein translocase protein TatB
MFDIGGWEFLLIVIVAIVVIGPKELPGAIRTVSGFVRKARELAREFQSGLEEVAHQAELDKLKNEVTGAIDQDNTIGRLKGEIESAIDPGNEIKNAMEFDREWRDDDLASEYPDLPEAPKEAAKPAAAQPAKETPRELPKEAPKPVNADAPKSDPAAPAPSPEPSAGTGKPS